MTNIPHLYDTPIDLLRLPADVGTPVQGKLIRAGSCYCKELTVYHARYWESISAGSRIDIMVEIPLHRPIDAGDFARFRRHIYVIEQVQPETDEDGLPIMTLSLRRSEREYDIADPGTDSESGNPGCV